jgi:transcriptional regulator with XRE-family HTH domain
MSSERMTPERLVGRNIAAARKEEENGREWLSQEALGQRLEFYLGKAWTKQAVSDAESGKRHLDPTELLAFVYALENVTLADLFEAKPTDRIRLRGDVPDIEGESLRWAVLPANLASSASLAKVEQEQALLARLIKELQEREKRQRGE